MPSADAHEKILDHSPESLERANRHRAESPTLTLYLKRVDGFNIGRLDGMGLRCVETHFGPFYSFTPSQFSEHGGASDQKTPGASCCFRNMVVAGSIRVKM
eukprot:1542858-Pyramimonas_sp.AAC.4